MIHTIDESQIREEIVRNSERLMIMNFYENNSEPCEMLFPVLKEIDEKYKDVEIYKINVNDANNFVITNNITAIPTLLFYEDGNESERIVGLTSIAKISNIIESYNIQNEY